MVWTYDEESDEESNEDRVKTCMEVRVKAEDQLENQGHG